MKYSIYSMPPLAMPSLTLRYELLPKFVDLRSQFPNFRERLNDANAFTALIGLHRQFTIFISLVPSL